MAYSAFLSSVELLGELAGVVESVRWGQARAVEDGRVALRIGAQSVWMRWVEASARYGWGLGRLVRNVAGHRRHVPSGAFGCVLSVALEGPLSARERQELEPVAARTFSELGGDLLFAVFSAGDGILAADVIRLSSLAPEDKLTGLVLHTREGIGPGEALARLAVGVRANFFRSAELVKVWREQGWKPLRDEEIAGLGVTDAEGLLSNPEAPGFLMGRFGMGDLKRAFERREFGGGELSGVLGRMPWSGRTGLLRELMKNAGPATRRGSWASKAVVEMVGAVLAGDDLVRAHFVLNEPDAWLEFMDQDPSRWGCLAKEPEAVLGKLKAARGAAARHYDAWLRVWSEPCALWLRCVKQGRGRFKGREVMARDVLEALLERVPGCSLATVVGSAPQDFAFLRELGAAQLPGVVKARFLGGLESLAELRRVSRFFGRDVLRWALDDDREAGMRMIVGLYCGSGDVGFLMKCVRAYGLDAEGLGFWQWSPALAGPLLRYWRELGGGAMVAGPYVREGARMRGLIGVLREAGNESWRDAFMAALRDGGRDLVREAFRQEREMFLELAVEELGAGELWGLCHVHERLGGLLEKRFQRGELVALVPAIRSAPGMSATDRHAYELAACFSLRDARLLLYLAHLARKAGAKLGCAFDRFYAVSEVPKKSGGKRVITAPGAALKRLQRRMVDNGLGTLALAGSCHGFRPGHSILSNASAHEGREMVVNVDIRGFFPSTLRDRVFGALYGRYSQTLSGGAIGLLAEVCCYGGALATGAPTSPVVANLVLTGVDRALEKVAARFGITYTRYADDLTFSGGADTKRILPLVVRLLKQQGYELDAKKTQIYRRGRRQMVTGLVVNVKANVPRWVRRRLRAAAHRVRQGGVPEWGGEEMSRAEFEGRVAQLALVRPAEFRALRGAIAAGMGGGL